MGYIFTDFQTPPSRPSPMSLRWANKSNFVYDRCKNNKSETTVYLHYRFTWIQNKIDLIIVSFIDQLCFTLNQ